MTRHDLIEWLAIAFLVLAVWKQIDNRWQVNLLWARRGRPWGSFRLWIAYRMTGVIPGNPSFVLRDHIEEHRLCSLPWIIFGSSK